MNILHQYIKREADWLQLSRLRTENDSMQIRIWLGHSMAIKRQVVVLNYGVGKWSGKLVTFLMSESSDEIDKIESRRSVTPKSGWKIFEQRLLTEQILTLPHSDSLPGYNGCGGADGIGYYFEIFTDNTYRFYYYCNLEYSTSFEQVKHVQRIADLLENEFSFNYTK